MRAAGQSAPPGRAREHIFAVTPRKATRPSRSYVGYVFGAPVPVIAASISGGFLSSTLFTPTRTDRPGRTSQIADTST